jgi:hypothetical protein
VTLASMTDAEQTRVLWSLGRAGYMLRPHQRELVDWFDALDVRIGVANCSRRFGKSFAWVNRAIGKCLEQPGYQARYGAPTRKMVRSIIEPAVRYFIRECPEDLRPHHKIMDGLWQFPNGSQLWIAGCDNGGYERLRGTSTDEAYVDEAGFIADLEPLIHDVLLPQLLTTDGKMVLSSTPPRSPAHPFVSKYMREAKARGAYIERDIYAARCDCEETGARCETTHITDAKIAEFLEEAGGQDSTTARREYLVQIVVDESSAVLPEFERNKDTLVEECERPPYFDAYTSIDFGFYDLTFGIFAHYDFMGAALVVEDEIVMARQHTEAIADAVRVKELELWGDQPTAYRGDSAPYLRIADAPPILLADMQRTHNMNVIAPQKDDKEAALNAVRLALTGHGPFKLRIHPRCTALVDHCRHAIWNKRRTSFERSAESGHFDGVDALVYLCRSVQRAKNPYPPLPENVKGSTHWISPHSPYAKRGEEWGRAFGPRHKW